MYGYVAQIFEGPAMDAKRKQREEREQILRERRSLNEMKEDERLALQIKRKAERLQVCERVVWVNEKLYAIYIISDHRVLLKSESV